MRIKQIFYRIIIGNVFAFMIMVPKFSFSQVDCGNEFLYLALLANAWQVDEPTPSFFPSNRYGLSYALLESMDIDPSSMQVGEFVEAEVHSEEVLFYKEDSLTIRPFYVVFKKEQYYFLSSELEDELCDYRESAFLFVPASGFLNKVQRDFSFSTKKDLIQKVNEQLDFQLNKDDFENYCGLLTYLKEAE